MKLIILNKCKMIRINNFLILKIDLFNNVNKLQIIKLINLIQILNKVINRLNQILINYQVNYKNNFNNNNNK